MLSGLGNAVLGQLMHFENRIGSLKGFQLAVCMKCIDLYNEAIKSFSYFSCSNTIKEEFNFLKIYSNSFSIKVIHINSICQLNEGQVSSISYSCRSFLLLLFFLFFNWDLLHARLNSHCKAWSYKKRKHKKIKTYRKSV